VLRRVPLATVFPAAGAVRAVVDRPVTTERLHMISDGDRTRIADAIRKAESQTSGEIYCVLARNAGSYRLVPMAWAALIALVIPLPLVYLTEWEALTVYVVQLAVFILAAFGLSRPEIRFHIVPPRSKRERAHAAALRQF